MKQLSDEQPKVASQIDMLLEKGNDLNISDEEALKYFLDAWDLVPDPKANWEISFWIAACIKDLYFYRQDYEKAKVWGEWRYQHSDNTIDVAPAYDLGMILFELGDIDEAYKKFSEVYNKGKYRPFRDRPQKYWEFYKEKMI